jgi:hypothetical protein
MPPNCARKRKPRHRRVSNWRIVVFKSTVGIGHGFGEDVAWQVEGGEDLSAAIEATIRSSPCRCPSGWPR